MFSGHSNLRAAGEEHPIAPKDLEEYFRCADDIVHFAENYMYIVSIDKGKHKIKLFEYQKKALKVFTSEEVDGKRNAIVLMPRQSGKCLTNNTILFLKNKKTGEIERVTIGGVFSKKKNGIS